MIVALREIVVIFLEQVMPVQVQVIHLVMLDSL